MRKKILLVLLIIIGIFIIATGVFVTFKDELFVFKNNKPIFTRDEPVLMGLKFGSTKRELIKKLGKPKKIKRQWWGAYGDHVEDCYYDWGYVELVPPVSSEDDLDRYIISVEINQKGVKGPRGIEIGDIYKKVLNKFRYTPKKINGGVILYSIEQRGQADIDKRFGVIEYDEKGKIKSIFYADGMYYNLRFEISKGRVKKIKADFYEAL